MKTQSSIVFLFDLVQDVNVLRPLIQLARSTTQSSILCLVSKKFDARDQTNVWSKELRELCSDLGTQVASFESEFDVAHLLNGRHGMIVSASESSLPAHDTCYRVFLSVPPRFIRVTVQHGYECVGFLHNRAHDQAYGGRVGFAADVICSWTGPERLTALSREQRTKLYVAGPPILIDPDRNPGHLPGHSPSRRRPFTVLVCENLHSVRMRSEANRDEFLGALLEFHEAVTTSGGSVHLRPHPAGRFTDKNEIQELDRIPRHDGPLYKQALSDFDLCVSAPSSVLIDFVMAGVPVAVWRDQLGSVDASNYDGLPSVTTATEWLAVAAEALLNRGAVLEGQAEFVQELGFPLDVRARYANLFRAAS